MCELSQAFLIGVPYTQVSHKTGRVADAPVASLAYQPQVAKVTYTDASPEVALEAFEQDLAAAEVIVCVLVDCVTALHI